MVCVLCGQKTKVSNSRPQKRLNQVWRRRECLNCGAIFTTEEIAQYAAIWAVVDHRGVIRPFSRDKLLLSLFGSLQHRKTAVADAGGLADTIIQKLAVQSSGGLIDRHTIIQTALVALNRFDAVASVHYSAFHS